ncbi:MAG: GFA family protein [Pseudomonadales bacterium]|nr:GFA family protein [Pseudomonadales bacterium]
MFDGSCLCGKVKYKLLGEPGAFGYCHCTSCRKASGSAHAANAPIDRSLFQIIQGKSHIREYESSLGKFRAFCTNCGSPLYAYLTEAPDVLRVRLGTIDTPFMGQPQAHTWVSDKAPWEPIEGKIPQFEKWAPKSVLHQRGSRQDFE